MGEMKAKAGKKVKRKEEEGGDHLYGNIVFVLYLYCNMDTRQVKLLQ
jgi:hypothetical protein